MLNGSFPTVYVNAYFRPLSANRLPCVDRRQPRSGTEVWRLERIEQVLRFSIHTSKFDAR